MVMIQVVLHYFILVDRGENTGDVIQADQVLHCNRIPGQLGIFVVIGRDADMNNRSGRKWTYPSTGLRATRFWHSRKRCDLKPSTHCGRKLISPFFLVDENGYDFKFLDWPWTETHAPAQRCVHAVGTSIRISDKLRNTQDIEYQSQQSNPFVPDVQAPETGKANAYNSEIRYDGMVYLSTPGMYQLFLAKNHNRYCWLVRGLHV